VLRELPAPLAAGGQNAFQAPIRGR
jgi:hypothetical protein